MLYITLRGHWCDISVLNVLAPTEDKRDDKKNSFHEGLEQVSTNSWNSKWKFCLEISMQKKGEKIFANI
jgi:hypothetical protein